MKDIEILYFAYGSNMETDQMAVRCPGAETMANAVLRGYRIALDETGYATVLPSTDGRVEGVLWNISAENERALDVYEGVDRGCYCKKTLGVDAGVGGSIPVLVYVSLREENRGRRVPGYLRGIIRAAEEAELSPEYLSALREL